MFTLVAAQVVSKSGEREQMGGFRLLWGNSATGFFYIQLETVRLIHIFYCGKFFIMIFQKIFSVILHLQFTHGTWRVPHFTFAMSNWVMK